MMPPAYSDSEYSDEGEEAVEGAGNPNRQPAVRTPDDDSGTDSDEWLQHSKRSSHWQP